MEGRLLFLVETKQELDRLNQRLASYHFSIALTMF